MNRKTYLVDAKRTAVGKYGKSLVDLSAVDLAVTVIQSIIKDNPKVQSKIDEVILGNVLPAGLGQNPARLTAIKGGISIDVPAFVVNKVCGSGLKSILLGVQAIERDDAQVILAGGMESMSQCPYYLDNYRFGIRFGNQMIRDGMIYDGLFCSLIGEHMGMTAEYIAKKYKISRKQQDKFAFESNKKALFAIENKKFNEEIVPINVESKKKNTTFNTDEQPRENTSIETLSMLKPAFQNGGTVTAGNSSSINDGASIVIIASEQFVRKNKIKPKVIIRAYASVGVNPKYMGLGAFYAAKKCLEKAGIKKSDVGLWEINEAFASQILAVLKLLDIDSSIVNVNGGAIALGHPIGASGARILTTLVHEMGRRKVRYGVTSLCIGGGQGISVLVENA